MSLDLSLPTFLKTDNKSAYVPKPPRMAEPSNVIWYLDTLLQSCVCWSFCHHADCTSYHNTPDRIIGSHSDAVS